jgi:hypothetical protein
LSDVQGLLCFAPALWNGSDPILKERLFGLGNPEGNHGEDIKDTMYHLAGTPTCSYAKALYRYPQTEFPYQHLRDENRRRSRNEKNMNLSIQESFLTIAFSIWKSNMRKLMPKTSSFDSPSQIKVMNHPNCTFYPAFGTATPGPGAIARPSAQLASQGNILVAEAIDGLGAYELNCSEQGTWLFTENETNTQALWGEPLTQPYVKDAFNRYLINGEQDAVNPAQRGSKAALHLHHNSRRQENLGLCICACVDEPASKTHSPTRCSRTAHSLIEMRIRGVEASPAMDCTRAQRGRPRHPLRRRSRIVLVQKVLQLECHALAKRRQQLL